eukprot:s25_g20.t1
MCRPTISRSWDLEGSWYSHLNLGPSFTLNETNSPFCRAPLPVMYYPSSKSGSSKDEKKEDHSITGKFDPTALERGAKALRELDTSPNAAKAFELTKLAEQTKQKELQLEIEQQTSMRTQAALQRGKQDAEEKRRTISHQQEQERRTAEYKARLDSELYQSKLEDQQKQIDQQLQMQHDQFLRQEEMRKRNNMELEEDKRRTQRAQAELDREAAINTLLKYDLLPFEDKPPTILEAHSAQLSPGMAKLSDEQLKLVKWRLEHGETITGRPFYDDPKFAKQESEGRFCTVANEAEKKSQAGEVGKMFGKPLSPEVVEEMHFAFIYAEDGSLDALDAWKRFCDMLRETEKILGAIDAPLRDSGPNLKWLVDNGADINATTAPALQLSPAGDMSLGLTPVLVAAQFGQIKALEILKSAGADLNFARVDGATALDLAIDQEHSETAAWLEQNGVAKGARTKAEAQGRMQQERENIEVRLREMRARMAEERKTRLDQIQAIFAGLGAGVQSVLEDRSKMTVLVGGLTALALGVYGARATTQVAGNIIERQGMVLLCFFHSFPTASLAQARCAFRFMEAPIPSTLKSAAVCGRLARLSAPGKNLVADDCASRRYTDGLPRWSSGVAAATLTGVALRWKARRHRCRRRVVRTGSLASEPPSILVLGGGLGGLNLAMRLSQMLWRTKPEVKLIDPKDRYVFLPLLIDYATGIVELDEFAPRFQDLLEEAPGVQHIQSLASEVDWRRRKVGLFEGEGDEACGAVAKKGSQKDRTEKLNFDAVVIASGSLGAQKAPVLPGLSDALADGKALCFRSLADAESLRERLKSLSSVAIIGAGYVGVELAAGLAEVLPEAAAAGQIALFGSRFLPGCEEANQRRSRVTSVDAEGLTWSSADGEPRKHECDLVIVTGALAPSDSKETLQLTAPLQDLMPGRNDDR